jgi:Mg-chelatase subunit ChlD
MGWTDCVPSRLDASKKATEAYIRRRAALSAGDRIGIVTFNKYGRVVLPLTEITRLDEILLCLASLRVAGDTDIAEGLKAANSLFAQDVALYPQVARYRRILILTDGRGGRPLSWATHLKNAGVLIEVIGVGGATSAVGEALCRKVATTDSNGVVHYWFSRDTNGLVAHYENLASGLIFRGHGQ